MICNSLQHHITGQVWANHEHGDAKLYNTDSEVNNFLGLCSSKMNSLGLNVNK